MNHSLLVVIKKAGEMILSARGNAAVVISFGIATGLVTVARNLAKHREGNYERKQKE